MKESGKVKTSLVRIFVGKAILWLISIALGVFAWVVAVNSDPLSTWTGLGSWLLFWVILTVYYHVESARRAD